MNVVAHQQRIAQRVERRVQHDPVLTQVFKSRGASGQAAAAMLAAAERRVAQIKKEVH